MRTFQSQKVRSPKSEIRFSTSYFLLPASCFLLPTSCFLLLAFQLSSLVHADETDQAVSSATEVSTTELPVNEISKLIKALSAKDGKTANDAFEKLKGYDTKIFPEIYPELERELKVLESQQESWFTEDRRYPDNCYNSPPAEKLITELGESAVSEMREKAVFSDSPYVRKTALYIFTTQLKKDFEKHKNIPTLLNLLKDSEEDIRRRAAEILGSYRSLSSAEVTQFVHHLQRAKSEYVRLYLAQGLCRVGNAIGLRIILQDLFNKDPEIRAFSAYALRLVHPTFESEVIGFLEKAVGNEKNKNAQLHIQGTLNTLRNKQVKAGEIR